MFLVRKKLNAGFFQKNSSRKILPEKFFQKNSSRKTLPGKSLQKISSRKLLPGKFFQKSPSEAKPSQATPKKLNMGCFQSKKNSMRAVFSQKMLVFSQKMPKFKLAKIQTRRNN